MRTFLSSKTRPYLIFFLYYFFVIFFLSLYYLGRFEGKYILLWICTAFLLYYDVLEGKKPIGLISILVLLKFTVFNTIGYFILNGKSTGMLGSGWLYVMGYGIPSFMILILGTPLLISYYRGYEA